jgi:hypothetical protein
VIIWKRLSHENILQLIGATMDGGKYRMVSPWMENGDIVRFLRKNYETSPNPLKLVRRMFHLAHRFTDSRRS